MSVFSAASSRVVVIVYNTFPCFLVQHLNALCTTYTSEHINGNLFICGAVQWYGRRVLGGDAGYKQSMREIKHCGDRVILAFI